MTRSWKEATLGERLFMLFAYLILIGWAVVSLFPLYWMVTTALETADRGHELAAGMDSTSVSLNNFWEAFANVAGGALYR
ncbi:MAG: hypothetical protein R3E79_22600 [Caldilineaceae bacterium]